MNAPGTQVYLLPMTDRGASRGLLLRCAADYAAGRGIAAADWQIAHEAGGKPYFLHVPQVHFSLSHSGEYWLCAFSSAPVGADLQQMRGIRMEPIVRRFYFPRERELVEAFGVSMFYEIWCAKEAYLKYAGSGLDWLHCNVDAGGETSAKKQIDGVRCQTLELPIEGYCACVCGGSGQIVLSKTE